MEEKHGSHLANIGGSGDSASESSTDTEEDDEGVLASKALDAQIQDTLEAIRRKDPRVYDQQARFYTNIDEERGDEQDAKVKKEKPMYLSDYHRKNLLEGEQPPSLSIDGPATYVQQQNYLKNDLVKEVNAATNFANGESSHDDDDAFMVRKPAAKQEKNEESVPDKQIRPPNIELADEDPETYLNQFLQTRAWVPPEDSKFHPFESDDEDEDERADQFEEAYNLRFEDPSTSNEKLLSHARDAAAKYSVRKETVNPRKRARELERERKDAAKQLRNEERARLRKLKVAEAEEKIKKIKEAAGLSTKSLDDQDWSAFIEEGWDDARWEEEMKKRFGDAYYADREGDVGEYGNGKSRGKLKKPIWEDDIEINDLVPEFEAEDDHKPQFSLTDEEVDGESTHSAGLVEGVRRDGGVDDKPKARQKVEARREKDRQKKVAREQRQKIERLVDQHLEVEEKLSNFSKKHAGNFRYRETSPTAFGLTPHDILMASDSQLNQYAGLKKLAAFRDSERKKKDKKHLGKKARLRQWRKDAFGTQEPDLIAVQNSGGTGSMKVNDNAGMNKKAKKRDKANS